MDEAMSEPRRLYSAFPGFRRTVEHARNYEEVRTLVLLLAEQSIGRGVAEELNRVVLHADHS